MTTRTLSILKRKMLQVHYFACLPVLSCCYKMCFRLCNNLYMKRLLNLYFQTSPNCLPCQNEVKFVSRCRDIIAEEYTLTKHIKEIH